MRERESEREREREIAVRLSLLKESGLVGFDEESWKDDLASPTDLQEDWNTERELTCIVAIGSKWLKSSSNVLLSCYSCNVSITESFCTIQCL